MHPPTSRPARRRPSKVGDHHVNGRALAKAQMPAFPPGTEVYNFQLETALELNSEAMAIVTAAGETARLSGEDERRAVHNASVDWNPKETPERFDLVVYKRFTLGRPSPLLPDPRQIPTAMIRVGEMHRMPLTELQERADEAFAMATRGDRPQQ